MSAVVSNGKQGTAGKQSDLLLWVGGAFVAVLGATWLLLTQPWSTGDVLPAPPQPTAAAEDPAPAAAAEAASEPELGNTLENPLRMAQLAFEAGMLIEPEEYSAWALYRQVLQDDMGNVAAQEGLERVADELVRRAQAAVEQGRLVDARNIADRILAALPTHTGALEIQEALDGVTPVPSVLPGRDVLVLGRPEITARQPAAPIAEAPQLEVTPSSAPPAPAPAPASRREPAPAPPRPDPVVQAFEQFEAAFAANRLLTPADASAKHFAAELLRLDDDHASTIAARAQLSSALLARALQALDTLDTTAASTWIDEAELLGVDAAGVAAARAAVTDRLAAMEAARPLPASALTLVEYVEPLYPQRANSRGLTGWVDIEFVVGTDGRTKSITVVDASHETMFRREAEAAIQQWRFEPRVFMGRTIEQRSFTRIRFVR